MLLRLGADVNSRNEFGNTPLHKAVMIGYNHDLIHLLKRQNADLAALNDFN